jgi:hypothetical protein
MSVSETVRIGELYPSGVQDLSKIFREVRRVYDPYAPRREDSIEHEISELVAEVEADLNIEDPKRTNAPYSRDLDRRVDEVNSATTVLIINRPQQVPEDIRLIQLAYFHEPQVGNQEYSYGLMMHYAIDPTSEVAVLLPYARDKNVPALILSNGAHVDHAVELITKALRYARERRSK